MPRRLLLAGLAVSLAFNLAFVATIAWTQLSDVPQPECCPPDTSGYPSEFHSCCNRLRQSIQHLRQKQAETTRRLADLLAAPEPDRVQLGRVLDQLAATNRSIHQEIVDTILNQRKLLPPEQRAAFCRYVHRRMCEPWGGCGPGACNLTAQTKEK